MQRLKTPFFLVALAAVILIVLVELGARLLLGGQDVGADLAGQAGRLGATVPAGATSPPGLAIGYLALVDAVVLFTIGLMGVGLLTPQRLQARLQGVATLVFAILLIITAVVLLVVAVAKLILMVTLFFAFPFGTIAYLIIWGSFPRGQATALLSLLMFLKLVFGAFLLLAQPRFIQNKGLVLLALTSMICNIVVTFLHGLVPTVLVSITDAVAAIVLAVVAIVWAIVLLVGAIPGIVRALRVSRRRVLGPDPPGRLAGGAAV
jgi:hypothetical protein